MGSHRAVRCIGAVRAEGLVGLFVCAGCLLVLVDGFSTSFRCYANYPMIIARPLYAENDQNQRTRGRSDRMMMEDLENQVLSLAHANMDYKELEEHMMASAKAQVDYNHVVNALNPVEDNSTMGAVARMVGRSTLQAYQSTVEPKARALARAVVTGEVMGGDISQLQSQIADMERRNAQMMGPVGRNPGSRASEPRSFSPEYGTDLPRPEKNSVIRPHIEKGSLFHEMTGTKKMSEMDANERQAMARSLQIRLGELERENKMLERQQQLQQQKRDQTNFMKPPAQTQPWQGAGPQAKNSWQPNIPNPQYMQQQQQQQPPFPQCDPAYNQNSSPFPNHFYYQGQPSFQQQMQQGFGYGAPPPFLHDNNDRSQNMQSSFGQDRGGVGDRLHLSIPNLPNQNSAQGGYNNNDHSSPFGHEGGHRVQNNQNAFPSNRQERVFPNFNNENQPHSMGWKGAGQPNQMGQENLQVGNGVSFPVPNLKGQVTMGIRNTPDVQNNLQPPKEQNRNDQAQNEQKKEPAAESKQVGRVQNNLSNPSVENRNAQQQHFLSKEPTEGAAGPKQVGYVQNSFSDPIVEQRNTKGQHQHQKTETPSRSQRHVQNSFSNPSVENRSAQQQHFLSKEPPAAQTVPQQVAYIRHGTQDSGMGNRQASQEKQPNKEPSLGAAPAVHARNTRKDPYPEIAAPPTNLIKTLSRNTQPEQIHQRVSREQPRKDPYPEKFTYPQHAGPSRNGAEAKAPQMQPRNMGANRSPEPHVHPQHSFGQGRNDQEHHHQNFPPAPPGRNMPIDSYPERHANPQHPGLDQNFMEKRNQNKESVFIPPPGKVGYMYNGRSSENNRRSMNMMVGNQDGLEHYEDFHRTDDSRLLEEARLEKSQFEEDLLNAQANFDAEETLLAEKTRIAEEKFANEARLRSREMKQNQGARLTHSARAEKATEGARSETKEPVVRKTQSTETARLAEETLSATDAKLTNERRLAEESRLVEQTRLAAQAREAEAARLKAEANLAAEELRLAEESRLAEQATLLEKARLNEEARRAEEKRLEAAAKLATEEIRLAEEKRLKEQNRVAEEARLKEEARLAEEKRLEAEAKLAAERARLAEEIRLAEERRLAEKALLETKLKAEAEKAAEESWRAKEAKLRAELENRLNAELEKLTREARLAHEAQLAEVARRAEESRIAEETRLSKTKTEAERAAEEARLAEAARLAHYAKMGEELEAARLEEERRLEATKEVRLAEEALLARFKAQAEKAVEQAVLAETARLSEYSKMEEELKAARLNEERRLKTTAEARLAEETKITELARLKADLEKATEKARLAEDARLTQLAKMEEDLKAARLEEERRLRATSEARHAELAKLAEMARLKEELEKATEKARLAEEARFAQHAKMEEELKATRLKEERRLKAVEEARVAEVAKLREVARLKAEVEKATEQARLAEEARLAQHAKMEAELKAARLKEEQRLKEAEAARLAEETRMKEAAAKIEELARRRSEEARIAEHARARLERENAYIARGWTGPGIDRARPQTDRDQFNLQERQALERGVERNLEKIGFSNPPPNDALQADLKLRPYEFFIVSNDQETKPTDTDSSKPVSGEFKLQQEKSYISRFKSKDLSRPDEAVTPPEFINEQELQALARGAMRKKEEVKGPENVRAKAESLAEDYTISMFELEGLARANRLSTRGSKADLIHRLLENGIMVCSKQQRYP